jgi:hypothetical protein
LTSFKAREALRNLKTTDLAFWAELTMNQPDENLPGMEETLPEDVEPDAGLEDADADDSDLSMPTLIAALTRDIPETVGSRKIGTLMSLSDAENVDLDPELVLPAEANVEAPKEEKAPEGSGQGKRAMHSGGTTTTMTGRMTVCLLLNESMGMWLECGRVFVMHPLSSTAKCYLTKILLFFDLSTLNTEIHQNTSPVIFLKKFKAFFRIFKWFRHLAEISVTSVTFQRYARPRYV